MKNVLNSLTEMFAGIIKWIPVAANATLGAIGDFLDAFGYAKAIIIAIAAIAIAAVKWIWSRLNR